jgi:PAS domain S-box-containing protein
VASLVALFVVSGEQVRLWRVLIGSIFMSTGIVLMHYTGMAAMRLAAMHRYHRGLVALSVALAEVTCLAALWLSTHFREAKRGGWPLKAGSSLLMGLAIPTMHYTGMAAVTFTPMVSYPDVSHSWGISTVATSAIILITLTMLGLALLASLVDRNFSSQAQEILRLQQNLLSQHNTLTEEAEGVRLLLDSTVEGIIGIDLSGNCTFCNLSALQQLGYWSERELIGHSVHWRIHHSRAPGKPCPESECPLFQSLVKGEPAHVDDEIFWRADGSYFPVEVWSHPVRQDGRLIGAVLTFWNTSQKKAAEAAQRRSEQLFKSIAEASADLIAVVDKKGNRIYNNPAYYRVFGYTADELKKSLAFDQIHPDDQEMVKRTAAESWQTGVGKMIEYRMRCKDGSYLTVESHASFIRNAQGEVEAFVISARDISQRKLAEQAQKLESIGQLAAGIAHEINTPVQYLSDNVHFLQDAWSQIQTQINPGPQPAQAKAPNGNGGQTPLAAVDPASDLAWLRDQVPKAIEQSIDGIHRISKIVGAMRKFSHSDGGGKSLADLNDALETTITVARNELKHIADVETKFQSDLPAVECLSGEMNQVFLNLIINAAHAIRDACQQQERRGKLLISTRTIEQDVQIEIKDNGTGIPDKARAHVFEPFFTTKEVGRGTGQGLTICHDIVVNKHGGKIWFDTELGQGTTFFVRIPVRARKHENAESR